MPASAKSDPETPPSNVDEDAAQLQRLGYSQQLNRSWHFIESFAASFCALNFIGGTRAVFFLGLLAGGPAAMWSSYIITMFFMFITAAVLAEICSALPLSGSIYIWAAESAGPKYARFAGVVVAWWICTAWMTFSAYGCQAVANYIVSLLVVMILTLGWAETPDTWKSHLARWYSRVFKIALGLMILDFSICVIWLPIGVNKTYGFRSAKEVFTGTYNGTGAPAGWNWILSLFFAAWTLTGFDAAGHIAEETKNARLDHLLRCAHFSI
ncbi:hypothetical protein M407DRAFT_24595 [Tulasnella calospora MUT 4182]|uniref:Amino acid permease/ SLC12A domain-containing protein n=1 Tax=Tulasnella calospora MUT 4182 TaxID=1051891 RepID=A0A0C3KXM9_9AGAM|nr:hypothetical protein M407DRAFT_24595 [Tulasnella calospora MUT 4182]